MTNERGRRRRFWLKILIGFCLSSLLLVVIAAVLFVYSAYDSFYGSSNVMIWNSSGIDVRFEKVTIGDQVIWRWDEDPPWLGDGKSVMLHFRAPRKSVELKVVILKKIEEAETLSCTLDNRSPPCLFEVFYRKGRLSCGECDKHFMH